MTPSALALPGPLSLLLRAEVVHDRDVFMRECSKAENSALQNP
jgi:hypothetical protein